MNWNYYPIIKCIHLYACLSTVTIFLMFVVTSFMMMHHDAFPRQNVKHTQEIKAAPDQLSDNNIWSLLQEQGVEGRVTRKYTNDQGAWIIQFANAESNTKVTVPPDRTSLMIERTQKDRINAFIDIHRVRGYGGPWVYNMYAFLLDVLGIGLILFVITGVIMWLKLLKNSWTAWMLFLAGSIYFLAVMWTFLY